MSVKSALWKALALAAVAAILAGCTSTTPAPTATPLPTTDPQPTFNAIQTQAAQTVVAGLTQNAPTATATQAATATPLPPTATATLPATPSAIPATSTPLPPTVTAGPSPTPVTPTSASFNCTVLSASPLVTDKMAPRTDFDGTWEVMNTGLEEWLTNDIDIVYVSGTKLQKKADLTGLDLSKNVDRNAKYTVIVDMVAPADPGTYYTTWAIKHGGLTMCSLNLTVTVK